jgi:hypothetical protein
MGERSDAVREVHRQAMALTSACLGLALKSLHRPVLAEPIPPRLVNLLASLPRDRA